MSSDLGNLPKTPKEARDIGVTLYFTGRPCRQGHITARFASSRGCTQCGKENTLKWRADNPEYCSEYQNAWRSENPDRNREIYLSYGRRRRSTPKGRLEDIISGGIRKSLSRGAKSGRRAFDLLGYTVDELKSHIEKQFQPGMTWDNYGQYGWHIDHRIPLSAHNYATPDDIDFKRAWALSNLQPMWWRDNLIKSDKLTTSFQPSLAIAA